MAWIFIVSGVALGIFALFWRLRSAHMASLRALQGGSAQFEPDRQPTDFERLAIEENTRTGSDLGAYAAGFDKS